MSQFRQPSTGGERLADVLLHCCSGASILLRLPAPATANDDAEQLGLANPEFRDVSLSPVAWRKNTDYTELLVSVTAVRTALDAFDASSAEEIFRTAAGIVAGGKLFEIVAVNTSDARGEPFCYRLTIRAPQP
jgi:hypothetical protein